MTTTYKIIEQEQISTDEDKSIEISEPTVNKKTITVAQLKREVEDINNQIQSLRDRKAVIKAQVLEIKKALSLNVTEIV
jgi:hypothetical protein